MSAVAPPGGVGFVSPAYLSQTNPAPPDQRWRHAAHHPRGLTTWPPMGVSSRRAAPSRVFTSMPNSVDQSPATGAV